MHFKVEYNILIFRLISFYKQKSFKLKFISLLFYRLKIKNTINL